MKLKFETKLDKKELQNILNKVNNLEKIINSNLVEALTKSAEKLGHYARENVRNWAAEPGLSQTGGAIANESSWMTNSENNNMVSISCISNHAAVVEFGGELTGTSLVVMTKGPGYPIGKQQGKPPIIRKSFLIQQPMAYFRSAKDSDYVRWQLRQSIRSDLATVIKNNI